MPIYDSTGRDKINPDPVLTQISIEFANTTDYIADRFFPSVRVNQQAGRYEVFGRRAFTRNFGGDVRAPGARANELEGRRRFAEDTYFSREHALEQLTPDEEKENNPDKNPENDAVEDLTQDMLLGKEFAARDLLYDPSHYHTGHVITLGTGEYFNEFDTSDPIGLFRDAFMTFHATMGVTPNLASIPWQAMRYLEDHPAIVERYAIQGGVITPEQIAAVLGIPEIIVPGGSYNEANPGQDSALTEIWGNNIVMGLVPSRPRPRVPALGYEFLYPVRGGRRQVSDIVADRRRDNDRIGWINRVRRRYDLKLVGRDPDLTGNPVVAGMLIENAVDPAIAQ